MTQVRQGLVMSDHIAWCEAERANAWSVIGAPNETPFGAAKITEPRAEL